MNDKDIEARLERSLRNQLQVPRLEKRFDAAVWARIDAEKVVEKKAAPASTNWMFVVNGIGLGVAFVLLCVFGLQSFSGMQVALPDVAVAPATMQRIEGLSAQLIAGGAVLLGFMFTPLGRRLRAEFS